MPGTEPARWFVSVVVVGMAWINSAFSSASVGGSMARAAADVRARRYPRPRDGKFLVVARISALGGSCEGARPGMDGNRESENDFLKKKQG